MSYNVRYWLTVIASSFSSWTSLAQTDTALALPPVTVRDARFDRTGYASRSVDSLPVVGVLSLADQLLWENAVTIRAGAPSTLATVSARGSGPSHTPVFWQGINLQSPMHGVVDAALIPLWAADAVEVRYGGQSAQLSSGAMGGAIHIHANEWSALPAGWFGQGALSAGSFHRWSGEAAAGFSQPSKAAVLRAAWMEADNDFPFTNTALLGAPKARQANNYATKLDVQQFNRWSINERNELETSVWYQRAYRQIPPTMTEAPSETWQRDRALRAVADWRFTPANRPALWRHRLGWLDERIDFYLAGASEISRSRTALAMSEYSTPLGRRMVLKTALNGWWQQAQAAGYADSARWFSQLRIAGIAMGEYRWRTGRLSASLRQEWAENQAAPFTWSLGARWQPLHACVLHAHISRNFNLPTFNDRYWKTLGNPDLRPENGYSAEIGAQWSRGHFSASMAFFHLLLDDWILWLPGADGLFRPGNLRQVWSRGFDASISRHFTCLGSHWKIKGAWQVSYATNTSVYDGNAKALHRQLPYTPRQSGSAMLHWYAGRWGAAYLHQWTGPRFRTADNSVRLPGFQTGAVTLKYNLPLLKNRFSLSARVENCWNTAYQILEFRPMPGRSWIAGVSCTI